MLWLRKLNLVIFLHVGGCSRQMATYHTLLLMSPGLIQCGGGEGCVRVLPTGRSFLMVLDLRRTCWPLHKAYSTQQSHLSSSRWSLFIQCTSLERHNRSNSRGRGEGLIIGARGFIVSVTLQVNEPITWGYISGGRLTVYKRQFTVWWRFGKIAMVNYLPPASKHIACQWQHVLHHHHFFSKLSQPWRQACLWICDK